MKHKYLFIALLMMVIFAAFSVSALAEGEFDHNIDFSVESDFIVSADNADFYVDLEKEMLFPRGATSTSIEGISYTGGKKWTAVSIPADGLDISKFLNKGGTIKLATKMDGKVPAKADAEANLEAATIITFPNFKARPKQPKVIVNYAVFSDPTGVTPGQWTITAKGSKSVIPNLQIATSSDKKNPDTVKIGGKEVTWGFLPTNEGINVKPLNESGKQDKTVYLIRTAPSKATLTPASKPKKFNVSGLSKAPKFKANYKTEIVKPKAGSSFYVNLTGASLSSITSMDVVTFDKTTAKTGVQLAEYGKNKTDIMGKELRFWTAAIEKKPASAVQVYTTAQRGIMAYTSLKVANGKVTVPTKTHSVFNPIKKTWGAMPTGLTEATKSLRVVTKETAKAGKETDSTYAKSADGELRLVWGDVTTTKKGHIAAVIEPPEYKGIIFASPEEIYFKANATESVKTVIFALKGLQEGANVVAVEPDVMNKTGYKVPSGQIVLAPVVSYTTNKSGSSDSVQANVSVSSSNVMVTITGNVACEATVSLKILIADDLVSAEKDGVGLPTDGKYNKEYTASGCVFVSVPEDSDVVKMKELQIDSATMRTYTFANAISGSTVPKAKANPGTIYISQTGDVTFSSEQSITNAVSGTTYTFDFKRSAKDYKDISSDGDFTSVTGAMTVSDGNTVLVTMKESTSEELRYFVYKVADASGPQMKSATVNGTSATITTDEDMASSNLGGASFVVQWRESGKLRTTSAVGASFAGARTINLTLATAVPSAATDIVVTCFSGGGIADAKGNKMKPNSINATSTAVASISFENANGYSDVVFALPKGFTDFSNYQVGKIYLNSTFTGKISVKNGSGTEVSGVEYALSGSGDRWTNARITTEFDNQDYKTLNVEANGKYIYLEADGEYYCFQVLRTTPAAASATNPTIKTDTAKFIRSGSSGSYSYQITFDTSEYITDYGYGLSKEQFEITKSDGSAFPTGVSIDVTNVSYSGTRVTLTLEVKDTSTPFLTASTLINLKYTATSDGVCNVSGNRLQSATPKLIMTGY